ncbi:uncharacterized protein METZ01_LOCUS459675, partial [marine metagenome]
VLSIATAPLPLKGDRMGTHPITGGRMGPPSDCSFPTLCKYKLFFVIHK